MHSKSVYLLLNVVGVIWVGGWGFVMFRYPKFFAGLNAWLGFKSFSSPKYVAFTKKLGIVEMVLAAISVGGFVVSLIFGLNWR